MSEIDLNSIHSPEDIRQMDLDSLRVLAAEIRATLIKKLSVHGGHVGPNLGMVEAIIALHYVFNAPEDQIVFDVSHQSYVHKMLTGRMSAFTDPARYDDVTGYTQPRENPDYDLFSLGHTSSSIALASGLAKARDMEGRHQNVVAVIGDASLGGGEALEGLNYAATLGTNFIIVVNDNNMSIAENHGSLYADLRMLRNTNGEGQPNVFRAFGFSYRYVHYGNDLRSLIDAFRDVKDIDHPVVVHINTMKGMGLPVAEANKEAFHYHGPFDPKTGAPAAAEPDDYTDIFANHILTEMKRNPRLAVITAGTPGAIGFGPDHRRQAGRQFIDVGIAEQMAVGLSAGMAKGGMRPIVGAVGTFIQRAYDQISQDVAINRLPSVLTLFHNGVYGINDETHLGFFDIAMISNIPGVNFLAPTCREEYTAMIDWAISRADSPVVVRTPGGDVVSDPARRILDDYSRPQYEIVRSGSEVALIGAGNFLQLMLQAAELLKQRGIEPTVINPRCLSALDKDTLDSLRNYRIVITAEDGIADGGFGQKVAAYLGQAPVRVAVLGLPKVFANDYDPADILRQAGLTPGHIADIASRN